MGTESNKDLNEEIDLLILEFFETVDDLYKSQSVLSEDMKNGFLNMSRARYSMGVKFVGISQCDESKMVAQKKVDVMPSDKDQLDNMLVLNTDETGDNKSVDDSDVKVETVGLRKRNVKNDDVDTSSDPVKEKEETKEKEKKKLNADPLKWFGVLLPQSLRQSQKYFQHAVEQSLQVANLKNKLNHIRKQYSELMAKKIMAC